MARRLAGELNCPLAAISVWPVRSLSSASFRLRYDREAFGVDPINADLSFHGITAAIPCPASAMRGCSQLGPSNRRRLDTVMENTFSRFGSAMPVSAQNIMVGVSDSE